MKRILAIAVILQLSTFNIQPCFAQKCVNPHFDAQRLDYRDLGYPGATEIAADSSCITALLCHEQNGKVYGATSGKRSNLFVYDRFVNKVFPLGALPEGEKGCRACLAQGEDGRVFIGSGLNEIELLTLSKDIPHGRREIENGLWNDIKRKYRDYAGGHVWAYSPANDGEVRLTGAAAKVEDLGVPVPNNSIYAMVMGQDGATLYGISYPDAEFFSLNVVTKETKRLGAWLKMKSYPGPERSWRGVPRALAVDRDGTVWSSGDNGLLRGYLPKLGEFVETHMRLPGEYWETQNCNVFPVVEQLFARTDGTLVGTSSDGFVFTAEVSRDRLCNWGKMRVERRVRAATLGKDGRLYLIAGEKDNVCRLFSFRTDEGHLDWGVLGVDRSPYYAKIAYQFDAMCTGADGTVFIGESDRRAKLFMFLPGAEVMPGVLNPTNPR